MPLTFLSHQAPAVALKLARPRAFDGTALVLGSMAPDFPYIFTDTPYEFDAHALPGVLAFCVPITCLAAWAVRARVAAVAFSILPSFGPLRLHDWRVLAARRPAWWATVTSAFLGALTHSMWDTFTHERRLGARLFPVLLTRVATVGHTHVSLARVFQHVGHVAGALVTLALLVHIARRGLLREWYGGAFESLTAPVTPRGHRVWFSAVVLACAGGGFAWGFRTPMSCLILRMAFVVSAGVAAFAFAVGGHPAYEVNRARA